MKIHINIHTIHNTSFWVQEKWLCYRGKGQAHKVQIQIQSSPKRARISFFSPSPLPTQEMASKFGPDLNSSWTFSLQPIYFFKLWASIEIVPLTHDKYWVLEKDGRPIRSGDEFSHPQLRSMRTFTQNPKKCHHPRNVFIYNIWGRDISTSFRKKWYLLH